MRAVAWLIGGAVIVFLWFAETNLPGLFWPLLVVAIMFIVLCLLVATGSLQGRLKRQVLWLRRLDFVELGSGLAAKLGIAREKPPPLPAPDPRKQLYHRLDEMGFSRALNSRIVGQDWLPDMAKAIRVQLGVPFPPEALSILVSGPPKSGKTQLADTIAGYLGEIAGEEFHVVRFSVLDWEDRQAERALEECRTAPVFLAITDNLDRIHRISEATALRIAEALESRALAHGIFLFLLQTENDVGEGGRLGAYLDAALADRMGARFFMRTLDEAEKVLVVWRYADALAREQFGIELSVTNTETQNETIGAFGQEAARLWEDSGQSEFQVVREFVSNAIKAQLADAANWPVKPSRVEPVAWEGGVLKLRALEQEARR